MSVLADAHTHELIERVAAQIVAWNVRKPALVFLTMHAPLAFFGSQFLIAAQPLLGMFGEKFFTRELAQILEDPQAVELLIARLENNRESQIAYRS